MTFFNTIKRFFKPASDEQVVGYSVSELKSVFLGGVESIGFLKYSYPAFALLDGIGVQAYYSNFVMDKSEVGRLQALIDQRFSFNGERMFNDLPVLRYVDVLTKKCLVVCISYKEFNVATIRLVSNDSEFLGMVSNQRFPVPPPWVAFEGYNASWWGGNMQGAQGYYNDSYFFAFFSSLSSAERADYYVRFSASEDWVASLEVMLDL